MLNTCVLGLIYRQHRPVHYSPSSRSALAEAELEYKDKHRSHAVYVAFDLDLNQRSSLSPLFCVSGRSNVKLLTFTTTPWTMSANMVFSTSCVLQTSTHNTHV